MSERPRSSVDGKQMAVRGLITLWSDDREETKESIEYAAQLVATHDVLGEDDEDIDTQVNREALMAIGKADLIEQLKKEISEKT